MTRCKYSLFAVNINSKIFEFCDIFSSSNATYYVINEKNKK